MGREDFSQSSQLTTLVGKPTNRYKKLPKNVGTIKSLTQARVKPNNRLHYSAYPLIQKEYSATYTQLTNLDFYSPIITILGNNPVSHLVGAPYVDAGVKVDEGSELYSTVSTVDTSEFGTYSVIYKARDGINADTTMTRVVKVGLPPVATINGQNPTTLEKFDVYTDDGITVNDSNSALVFTTSTVNNIEVGTYTVNYTVSNPAFTKVFSRTVRVDDTVPPVITITGGTPYELERFDPYVDEGATVDVGSELTNTDLSNVQNTAIGSFDVVYTAYDGNTTVSNIRTVNVVDTVPPVITITNNTLQGNTLERFESYVDEGATVDLGSELTNTDLSNEQNTTPGTFDVVYTAYDGNTTVTATRTVTVVDTKLPELTLIGDTSPYNLQPGVDFENVDPGFSNDAGTVVTVDYSSATIIQNTSFDVVYRGNDGVHPEIVLIRRVSVADTLSPIVTINGDQVVTIERYSEYVDDDVTLDPGSSLVNGYPISTVDNTATGTYTVTYLATDGINPDTTNVRTVHVVDTTPPIVLLNGADPLTMERFAVFSDIDPGVTYQSPHTGTVASVDISQLDNTAIGGGTVTYNVVDDENKSNTISRAVTVVDTTRPVATLNNASTNYTLERYGDWSAIDPGVTVDEGSFVTQINIDNTTVGLNRPVDYVISDGNTLHDITVTRNITIEDTVPPFAELIGSNNIRVPLNSVWEDVDPGLQNFDAGSSLDYVSGFSNTVTDAQFVYYNLTDGVNSNNILRVVTCTTPDGEVNTAVSTTLERFSTYVEPDEAITGITDGYLARIDTSNVDSTTAHGTQQVIVYDLGDGVNSNLLLTRTITIQDTVAPVITITNDTITGNTLERFDVYSDAGASVDPGSVLTTDLSQVQNTATGTTFDVVYTANDGNTTSTAIRTVTVVDTTPPLITLNGDNPYYVERFSNFVDPFAYADAGSTMLPADLSNVDTSLPYGDSFDVVYSAVDISGSNTAIRTVILDGEQAKIQASDKQASDFFGFSVSISEDGNTAIVAASHDDTTSGYNNAGGAYIFTRSGTTWTQQAKIQASDGRSMHYFGWSIAISGDGNTAIVGAFGANSAYIFTRSGTSWSEQQKIQAASDLFGRSVSMSDDGNTAIVGAPGDYPAGAAYIFTRSGTTWTQQQKIQASDKQADDYFGTSVSISSDGNTAIVGAYGEDTGATSAGATSAGAAYIFTWSGTTWTQQQKIQASDKQASDFFGFSVSISEDGNTAIVGAYGEDTGGSDAGAAYIFTRSGTSWSEQQKIQASDKQASDQFGRSVSISDDGNTAIVGAYLEDTGATEEDTGVTDAGSAYIFTRSGTTWTQQRKIQASDKQAYDYFGWSVAISGDGETTIVGAIYEDTVGAPTGASDTGAAYIYRYNF